MLNNKLAGCRVLLVQSDALVALQLAGAFAEEGAEVVTTFGLAESFYEIGREFLEGAIVHLDLDGVSALPVAVLLHEMEVPLVIVSPNRMSAFLARHLPGAVALEPDFSPELAVSALVRAAGHRPRQNARPAAMAQAPQRQNRSPSWP